MANDYIDISAITAMMPDTDWGQDYDGVFGVLASRASRAIDRFTKREPGAFKVDTDTTRYFDGSGGSCLWIGELAAAPTSVSMTVTTPLGSYTDLASSDYILWPYNALLEERPYQRLDLDVYNGNHAQRYGWPKAVRIVGKFGYSTEPPDEIVQACVIQAVRWFKRAQQAYQDTGAVIELGQLTYTKALDPEVALLIQHYTRTVV